MPLNAAQEKALSYLKNRDIEAIKKLNQAIAKGRGLVDVSVKVTFDASKQVLNANAEMTPKQPGSFVSCWILALHHNEQPIGTAVGNTTEIKSTGQQNVVTAILDVTYSGAANGEWQVNGQVTDASGNVESFEAAGTWP